MSLSTRLGRPGEVGFDTLEPISDAMIPALVAEHLTFAIRTIQTLSAEEVLRLTAAGIAVAWYSEARTTTWNTLTGSNDGAAAARKALAIGLPAAVSGGCDMEDGVPNEATAVAYGNAWYLGARNVGLTLDAPMIYRGAGSGFTSPETLFHKLAFRRYWRSMSVVPDVAVRGDCVLQLYPPNQKVGAAQIDYDVVQSDYLGGLPCFAVAA